MPEHAPIQNTKTRRNGISKAGFQSCKTKRAIPYPMRWHHDLLIQISLDPQIGLIDQHLEKQPTNIFIFVIHINRSRRIITAVTEPYDDNEIPSNALIVHRGETMGEPRRSNARLVWASRNVRVSTGDRMRVLTGLADHPEGIPLKGLAQLVQAGAADPFESILSLACCGVVAIDLSSPLRPESLVRLTPPG